MWNKPWKYREGIAISVGLLITGALLQVSIGPVEWLVFMWPANIIALAILIVALGLFYAFRSKVYLFKFMTQVEAAVPALAAASVLTIIMGLSRQVPEGRPAVDPIGLTRMLSFWPFVLIYLWNIVIFDSKTGKVLPKDKPQNIIIEQNFTSEELLGWNITVEKYIEDAMPASMLKMMKGMPAQMMQMMKMDDLGMRINAGGFVEYKGKGAATAILIKAQKGSVVKKGWVSSGSYMFPMSSLKLDDKTEIAMSAREPLRYASDVNVYTQDGNAFQAHIEVNKPFSIGSWKIYQLDFNKEQGKWSTLSVYELVSDPWLPATYVGIYLLLIGAVLMFITAGRNKYKKEEDKK